MSRPTVTAIIPVRNGARYVEDLAQRLSDVLTEGIDVVLVDDHSTDDTRSKLDGIARTHVGVEVLANSDEAGVAAARNFALNGATGEYVWFADADDVWDPTILQTLRALAMRTNADICVCRADVRTRPEFAGRVVDGLDRESVIDRAEAWRLVMNGRLHGYLWNKLIRRETLGADPFLRLSSQSDFTGVVSAISRADHIAFTPEVLYHHLVREGSITRSVSHRVGNLAACVDRFRDLAGLDVQQLTTQPEFAYFRVWFQILPMAETPARVGAAWRDVAKGGARARRELATLRVRSLPRSASGVRRKASAVKLFGPVYSIARGILVRIRMRLRGKPS